LREGPARIAAATRELSAAQLRAAPAPDAWSAVEVLAHLRSCADVWGGYIARIVAEDTPKFRAVNPRQYIKRTDYPELEFAPSLAAYAAQRAELLRLLRELPAAAWERRATVMGTGSQREWTVYANVARLARHEGVHVQQLGRITRSLRYDVPNVRLI